MVGDWQYRPVISETADDKIVLPRTKSTEIKNFFRIWHMFHKRHVLKYWILFLYNPWVLQGIFRKSPVSKKEDKSYSFTMEIYRVMIIWTLPY